MTQSLNEAGDFRGFITSYGLYKPDSGAIAIGLTVTIAEAWDNDQKAWCDWTEHGLEVIGNIWIIKKTGETIKRSIQSLLDYAGWDGDMTSVENGQWKPTPIQVSVEPDEYKGETRYRIAWINEYDREPGGTGSVSPEDAKALQQQYGSKIRALAGNSQRAAATPQGTAPVKPAPAQSTPAPATTVAPVQPAQPAPVQPTQPAPTQPVQPAPAPDAAAGDQSIPF